MTQKNKPKVLVIDDDASQCEMLTHGLSRAGYAVVTVSSGEQGIERIKSEDFDAVICDVIMPGIGGVATLRTLKQIRPAMEIIIVTGYPDSQEVGECARLGAFAFLFKPYELNILRAALEKAVERRRERAAILAAQNSSATVVETRPSTEGMPRPL